MMRIYKKLAIVAVLLLTISHLAIAQDKAMKKMDNIRLYGQEFTLSEPVSELNAASIGQVLPGVSGGVEKDVKGVLEALGQSVDAQRSAYESGLTQLAETLDKGGYLPAMFMRPNADGYLSIDLKDPVLVEMGAGDENNRVNYIKGEVEFWVMQGDWQDKVTAYNTLADGHLPALDGAGIAELAQQRDSFMTVQKLDLAVRQSEEVQAAGLTRHGIVEPKPVEFDVGGQNQAAPSWMGNASDGVRP